MISSMRISISLFIFLVFCLNQVVAQELQLLTPTPEEQFALMRTQAQEGNYPEAKSIGQRILEKNPDYFDVAIYIARIYGWETNYDSAYLILEDVLLKEPDLFEAHETLVDLAYWENDWFKLEQYAARAMELEPDSEAMKEKYLLAKSMQGSSQDAPELFLHYSYDHFGVPYIRNWHMLTVGANVPM
ncbi:MAG: tetratricopeptide repeat protein, partial [Anaerolineales bacterium]|nr:tetratricopeptide repeat protein [Anaerolineales bacterium]